MSDLFQVAEVIKGDGPWSGVPYDRQYDASAKALLVQDVCVRANTTLVAGSTSLPAVVYTIRPVGAMVSAVRPNRCVLGDFPDFEAGLLEDLDADSSRAAGNVLYNGLPGWTSAQPYLVSSDVATVSAVANDVPATVAAVLDAWYGGRVGEEKPTLHLGLTAAMRLSSGNATSPTKGSGESYLTMDGTPIVVCPEYPTNTVAATGPVVVRLGSPGILVPAYDYATNRTYFTTERIIAVEFDASIAVRAT